MLDNQEVEDTDHEDEEAADLASGYAEYDRFSFIAIKNLPFRGKNLEEWLQEVAIPDVDATSTHEEFERLNYYSIKLNEKVTKNYSYSKSVYDLATIKWEAAYHKEKIDMLDRYQKKNMKLPKADITESAIRVSLKDQYSAYKIAELFYEFWKTIQAKVKSFDGRLTSISMIQNLDKRNTRHDA